MKKPDIEQEKTLIIEAPIGQYVSKEGAQILADCACCTFNLKENEFLFHQGYLQISFYVGIEGRLSLVKEKKKHSSP